MKIIYILQAAALVTTVVLVALGYKDAAFIALIVTCCIVAIGVVVKLLNSKKRF